jgi:cell wall-associated NlpC family hydrolase
MTLVMLRRAFLLPFLALALGFAPPAHAATLGGWSAPQQRHVVAAGVMQDLEDGRFHGERPVRGTQLRDALTALAAARGAAPVRAPAAPVRLTTFDALVVEQLGLDDAAATVQREARGAGLRPPRYFGTEVVARLLGLRTDHPVRDEALERYPSSPVTRAEAAWSFAQAVRADADAVRSALSTFRLPAYTARQLKPLRIAVAKIGMPYVWGGELDRPGVLGGPQRSGGYDCSGLVWRVFKLSGLPQGRQIGGRTAAQQAGQIPKDARVRLSEVRPADLLFFGSARFDARATERSVTHEGIALSADWMINASGQGVALVPITGPYARSGFTWGRRLR